MKGGPVTKGTQYYLYGETPVKMELTPEGGLQVSVFDLTTGTFQRDATYRSRILHDRDNLVQELDSLEFERQVSRLSRRVVRAGRPYRRIAEGRILRSRS